MQGSSKLTLIHNYIVEDRTILCKETVEVFTVAPKWNSATKILEPDWNAAMLEGKVEENALGI